MRFWTLHEEGKTPDERSIRYGVPDKKARKWETRGGRRGGAGDHLTSSGGSGSSSNVVRMLRIERPVSGKRQDTRECKKDVPDATPDRRHIRSGGLRFGSPVRQMHGTHGTQDIIFADVGFRGGSCVGPRGGTKGRRETRRCHGRGSGTQSLSEKKKVVWEWIVHLVTWCCKTSLFLVTRSFVQR